MYCSWIGKICIFVTMINSQDKILQKTERMIYFHIMFMSASSIKRKPTLLLREATRSFIFRSATTFPGKYNLRIMATLIGDESPTPMRRSDGFDVWTKEIPRVGHKFPMYARDRCV